MERLRYTWRCFYGHLEVARVLFKNDADLADLRVKNRKGETPLDLASKERHHDIAQLSRETALIRSSHGERAAKRQIGKETVAL